jgi:hypothetical protein
VGHARTYGGQDRGGTGGSRNRLLSALRLVSGVEGMLDLPVGDVVLAVDAVGVNGQERGGAVPCSSRDLGGCGTGVQPERQCGAPQVIGAAGKSGGSRRGPEGLGAGGVPGAAVATFAERSTAGSAEQSAVGCGAVAAMVAAEHGDQDGRVGNGPNRSLRSVLEAALFVAGSVAGPGCGGAGRGLDEGEDPPAVAIGLRRRHGRAVRQIPRPGYALGKGQPLWRRCGTCALPTASVLHCGYERGHASG